MGEIDLPLNLEMAATAEMLAIALRHRPHAACIVPERREERTTEGGLDAAGQSAHLAPMIDALSGAAIRVSLFIERSAERRVGKECVSTFRIRWSPSHSSNNIQHHQPY